MKFTKYSPPKRELKIFFIGLAIMFAVIVAYIFVSQILLPFYESFVSYFANVSIILLT